MNVPTPITDAALIAGDHEELGLIECVPAELCRTLERKLAESQARIADLELDLERWKDPR